VTIVLAQGRQRAWLQLVPDLSKLLKKAVRVSVSETTVWRCLQRTGITPRKDPLRGRTQSPGRDPADIRRKAGIPLLTLNAGERVTVRATFDPVPLVDALKERFRIYIEKSSTGGTITHIAARKSGVTKIRRAVRQRAP
jgi:hypothetical protein